MLTYAAKWHGDIWYRRVACLYRRLEDFAHFQLLYDSALSHFQLNEAGRLWYGYQ